MNFQNTKCFISKVVLNTSSALFLTIVAQGQAKATAINGFGSPSTVISGGAIIDFESASLGRFSTRPFGNVTISGIGGDLSIDNAFSGQFNTQGRYLQNSEGATNGINFSFSSPVNQFAFNFGATNLSWLLSAFDVNNNFIESTNSSINLSSNAGDYIGLANNGISYATFTVASSDYILIDNFTSSNATAVPEPFSIIGTLVGGTAALRMRKKLKAIAE